MFLGPLQAFLSGLSAEQTYMAQQQIMMDKRLQAHKAYVRKQIEGRTFQCANFQWKIKNGRAVFIRPVDTTA